MLLKKGAVVFFIIVFMIMLMPSGLSAESNTALTLIKVAGGTLAAVEIGHLIYWAVKKIRFKKKIHKPPLVPVETNQIFVSHETNTDLGEYDDLFVNLGEDTNMISQTKTNTNLIADAAENLSNNIITNQKNSTNEPAEEITVMTDTEKTNQRAYSYDTNLIISHEQITNLTEKEKQDIALFGRDYYYLVSLAYYRVKKYQKAKEFMFHSLAIGEKVDEGLQFLKENFHLSGKEIQFGIKKYINARQ